YMDHLQSLLGDVSLVIALDSTCGNYDQLWITTSLRGMLRGELKVEVLEQGAHSGNAGGVVPSSFMILRQILSRLEDDKTGEIFPSFLNEQIPDARLAEARNAGEVLKDDFNHMFTYMESGNTLIKESTELVLNNTWRASLEITGMDGIPAISEAGNVLRPYTSAKLALRIAPTTSVTAAKQKLEELLTREPPFGAKITFRQDQPNAGWHAPLTNPVLAASMQTASENYFGAPAISMGCGGSIPFMQFLADKFPEAQFVVTGVLGPHSNAHGPNEFLHIPTAVKLTACIADILFDWGQREN
ncbi:MAG: M20/M25/M40 family metallo-hydrolase, partial [Gammaproteobacteria bacterium]|nr:M20/M25/M40 family metallo-hydrolase [Gammaproteobacteria bacterium]